MFLPQMFPFAVETPGRQLQYLLTSHSPPAGQGLLGLQYWYPTGLAAMTAGTAMVTAIGRSVIS